MSRPLIPINEEMDQFYLLLVREILMYTDWIIPFMSIMSLLVKRIDKFTGKTVKFRTEFFLDIV